MVELERNGCVTVGSDRESRGRSPGGKYGQRSRIVEGIPEGLVRTDVELKASCQHLGDRHLDRRLHPEMVVHFVVCDMSNQTVHFLLRRHVQLIDCI
jgi:hypothetical protein